MIDFSRIKTIPIASRKNKFKLGDLIKPANTKVLSELDGIQDLSECLISSSRKKKKVIWMMGAHVIKTGMSLLIIDLMKKGVINHIAMNGAGPIHDFEIALIGETSEYVEDTIEDGTFGMIEETGRYINEAAKEGAENGKGFGYSIGKKISDMKLKFMDYSIFYHAYMLSIPVTVHVAIGTDIIHQHPTCDGASIGKTSYQDFKIFADSVSGLEGGVIVNAGSAVILPEVFLKGITIARNLGFKVRKFVSANLDMIDHYRPRENVLERPTSLGGRWISIIEKHEISIPTLHRKIIEGIEVKK